MLETIDTILKTQRKSFSREKTFNWAVIVILGFMVREDTLGVTSIIRSLYLSPGTYENMIHFFHSDGWCLQRFYQVWWSAVYTHSPVILQNGRLVVLGDHTDVSKDGRKMPCVRRMKQSSETSSKPNFYRGHKWGFISLLLGTTEKISSIPLSGEMHQKAEVVGIAEDKSPITERIVAMAIAAANHFEISVYLILDRFFAVKTVFNLAYNNVSCYAVLILTLAKSSYVAYEKPTLIPGKKKKKYGNKIKLFNRFSELKGCTQEVLVYGKKEIALVYGEVLLWKPIGRELLFIWAETSRGRIVLMSSDLELEPIAGVELYCKRAKIESLFSVFKNLLGGFGYHFWSKHLESQSRNPKKQKQRKLKTSDAASVVRTRSAIERFVALQIVACGILQILAFKFSEDISAKGKFWMRTISSKVPSERVAKRAILFSLISALLKNKRLAMIDIIKQKQSSDTKIEN